MAAGLTAARDLLTRAGTPYQRILLRALIGDWDRWLASLERADSNRGPRGYPAYAVATADLLGTLEAVRRRVLRSEASRR